MSIKAPLKAFDGLLTLIKNEALTNEFDPKARHPKCNTLLKRFDVQFGKGIHPMHETVSLENAQTCDSNYSHEQRDTADVYSFDAKKVI